MLEDLFKRYFLHGMVFEQFCIFCSLDTVFTQVADLNLVKIWEFVSSAYLLQKKKVSAIILWMFWTRIQKKVINVLK